MQDVALMVFLRPTVTRTIEDVRRLMEEERQKARETRAWERDLDAHYEEKDKAEAIEAEMDE